VIPTRCRLVTAPDRLAVALEGGIAHRPEPVPPAISSTRSAF
jgi:hypothetical protein